MRGSNPGILREQFDQLKYYVFGSTFQKIMVNYGTEITPLFKVAFEEIVRVVEGIDANKEQLSEADIGHLIAALNKHERLISSSVPSDELSLANHTSRVCLLFALTPLKGMIRNITSGKITIDVPTTDYFVLFKRSLEKILLIQNPAQRKQSVHELEVAVKKRFGLPAEY